MNTHQRDIEASSAKRFVVSGRVQGVGFRPFVYRAAHALGLNGWVRNETGRVVIHVEGRAQSIELFTQALVADAPPLARPHLEASEDALIEEVCGFRIADSIETKEPDAHLPPDLFSCADCVAEFQDPLQRRYRYPFTNCTQCGPRYSIIGALPYDRPNTSMARFALCPLCRDEYQNPLDRRFHAQPLGCPKCGPALLFRCNGRPRRKGEEALEAAIACLREGRIVAVKGVGGYHLMCDAANDDAVRRLRTRKRRPHKPLAIMFPQIGDDGLAAVREHVDLREEEACACADPLRPVVLARRRMDSPLSDRLAPGLAELGVFLPYSPLHHLLLADFGAPLVATSGNISGEPVITDNDEAERHLAAVADAFLHHDRPILRPADDCVVRVIAGNPRPIRVGRGMSPLEIDVSEEFDRPTLAVGAHMKAAVALGWGRRVVISPHIGDLDSPRSLQIFEQVIADLQALYRVEAQRIVCDAHPGYGSTRWATAQGFPIVPVQHHAAHASALAGEHPEVKRWLVITWDGVGLGGDGDLWGGEAFLGRPGGWRRVGSLRPFHVIGGDRVGREPWRSAAALMWQAGHDWIPAVPEAGLAAQAWSKRMGTARTSSIGRLFDAASSLILGIDQTTFEGQGPMMLESIASSGSEFVELPMARDEMDILRIDWQPLLPMLCDVGLSRERRAGIFHQSLARAAIAQAVAISETESFEAVGLTGGVFQNRVLAERVLGLLAERGVRAHMPRIVPANDGGIAFGQLIEALGRDPASGTNSRRGTP